MHACMQNAILPRAGRIWPVLISAGSEPIDETADAGGEGVDEGVLGGEVLLVAGGREC